MARGNDWERFGRELEKAGTDLVPIPDLLAVALPRIHGSEFWCSSDEFHDFLKSQHPKLTVPEHDIAPLIRKTGWTPSDEAGPAAGSPCANCGDAILPGDRLFCPSCERTGFEWQLLHQKKVSGLPPAYVLTQAPEPVPEKVWSVAYSPRTDPPGKTRKQRRAEQFARPSVVTVPNEALENVPC